MRRPLVAFPLLLAACAVVPVKPADDRLSRLPPADRSSLLVDEDYVRLAMYLPGAKTGAVAIASQQVNGKLRYTFAGPVADYQDGALDWDAIRPLQEARARSPYHQPVQAEVEGKRFWFVPDRVPKLEPDKEPEIAQTLEMYDADPRESRSSLPHPVRGFLLALEQRGFLGVENGSVTPSDIKARGLPAATRGAIVRSVSPGGPADRAGILPGDVILAIDGIGVTSPEDLTKVVSKLPAGSEVTVSRLRGDERREVRGALGLRGTSSSIVRHEGSFFRLQEAWFAPGFLLQAVNIVPWRPSIDEIVQGKSSRSIWGEEDARTESAFNDTLVEWKNRGMPGWLRGATAEQLAQAILTTEKGVLALDVSIRVLKDKIDAAARDGKDGIPGAGEAEQLLEQRKMLLGVLLGAMKSAASQVAPAPAIP